MSDSQSINLGDDNFVRSVINRQVGKLIAKSDFTHQDRSDLVQEVYVRATKSLQLYDPSVGHLYPYVCTLSTTDPDAGDTFTFSLVTGTDDTDNGAFNISGGNLRATSSFDFETKSSYTIRIRSTDQGGLFVEKVFAIRVLNTNDAPVAVGDSYWVSVDTFQRLDILVNDSDVDSAIDPTSIEIFSPPLHGTATPMPDGTVRYTPKAGYRGAESFTYRVRDSLGLLSN